MASGDKPDRLSCLLPVTGCYSSALYILSTFILCKVFPVNNAISHFTAYGSAQELRRMPNHTIWMPSCCDLFKQIPIQQEMYASTGLPILVGDNHTNSSRKQDVCNIPNPGNFTEQHNDRGPQLCNHQLPVLRQRLLSRRDIHTPLRSAGQWR